MLRDVQELSSYFVGSKSPVSQPHITQHQQHQQQASGSGHVPAADATNSSMFEGLYNALGGWIFDARPEDAEQQAYYQHRQPLLEQHNATAGGMADRFSFWDLRAAMFLSNCLPVRSPELHGAEGAFEHNSSSSGLHQGAVSTTAALADTARQQQRRQGSGSSHGGHGGGGAETNTDALKGATHPDTPSKQCQVPPGLSGGMKHSSSHASLEQPQPTAGLAAVSAAAAAAASDVSASSSPASSSRAPATSAASGGEGSAASGGGGGGLSASEAARLRRALRLMAARMEELRATCCRLQEENARLRSAGGEGAPASPGAARCPPEPQGDAMLTEAVTQLLRDKSDLQQEVGRLHRQNAALQELLEYTAAAAGGGGSGPSAACSAKSSAAAGSPQGSCGSSGGHQQGGSPAAMQAAAAEAATAALAAGGYAGCVAEGSGESTPCYFLVTPAASNTCSSAASSSPACEPGTEQQQQQQQQQQLEDTAASCQPPQRQPQRGHTD